jgi:hypothetical protein
VPEHEVAYPTPDFVSRLASLQEGEAARLSDQPGDHFYIAYAAKRHAPEPISQIVTNETRQNLFPRIQAEQQKKFYRDVMLTLRREAAAGGELNAKGRFVLRPGIKAETDDATAVE